MEKILESAWALFVAIGWFFINRITAKVDALEKDKADNSAIGLHAKLIHETDRRIDEIQHTTVPRQEYKADIAALHSRANELERSKEDKVTDVRIVNLSLLNHWQINLKAQRDSKQRLSWKNITGTLAPCKKSIRAILKFQKSYC